MELNAFVLIVVVYSSGKFHQELRLTKLVQGFVIPGNDGLDKVPVKSLKQREQLAMEQKETQFRSEL